MVNQSIGRLLLTIAGRYKKLLSLRRKFGGIYITAQHKKEVHTLGVIHPEINILHYHSFFKKMDGAIEAALDILYTARFQVTR